MKKLTILIISLFAFMAFSSSTFAPFNFDKDLKFIIEAGVVYPAPVASKIALDDDRKFEDATGNFGGTIKIGVLLK